MKNFLKLICAAFLFTACTDYLDEFKDEYEETFVAIENPSSDSNGQGQSEPAEEPSSSVSNQETLSSSSVKPGSSASVSSSSNNKDVSSSSAESSSSVDDGRVHRNRIGPVSQYGRLIAGKNSSGKGRIYGGCEGVKDGAEVQVRGTSLYWSLMPEALEFWTEEGITTLVDDMKIEVVRAAMAVGDSIESVDWKEIQQKGYLNDPAHQKQYVKTVVEAAIKNDIYVIVDWHLESNQGYTDEAVEFFDYVAKEYGGYNNVIFEVWSEPINVELSAVVAHANAVISAIRKYSGNLVLVGSTQWSSQPNKCAAASIQDDNFACTLHFYAGSHMLGATGYDNSAQLAMTSYGVPVFVSEWASVSADGNGEPNQSSSDAWEAWMKQNYISWTNWNASKVSRTSAAFTSSATKTSLQYTTSGELVKGYLAKNPSSYTDCGQAN